MYVNARLTFWQIILSCGKSHEIMNVTEPRHCEYEVLFHTPLVCHQHSMLVYPTLDEALRHRWDTLMSELQAEEITEKVCYNVLITSHLFDYSLSQRLCWLSGFISFLCW